VFCDWIEPFLTSWKDNIIFGSAFEKDRYDKGTYPSFVLEIYSQPSSVIYQCALEQDLSMFDAGDMTEVGEKGITLR
jgi:hypothetical protein